MHCGKIIASTGGQLTFVGQLVCLVACAAGLALTIDTWPTTWPGKSVLYALATLINAVVIYKIGRLIHVSLSHKSE